jgi:signal recognition particle receptor subunit beta
VDLVKRPYGPLYALYRISLHQLNYGKQLPTQTSMSINSATIPFPSSEKQITIIDCPGNPRLAHLLRHSLSTHAPRGIIILLDSASINRDLNAVANIVYSTLLALPRPVDVLIVANKSDLFTALPVNKVRDLLESEISSIKKTRDDSVDDDEERVTLGGLEFKFDELESDGVVVEWTRSSIESEQVEGILRWIVARR